MAEENPDQLAAPPSTAPSDERVTMVEFTGDSHPAFTVTDLDVSERFYTSCSTSSWCGASAVDG